MPLPTSHSIGDTGHTADHNAIVGALAGLPGGTTGQVPTKNSATDFDFSWATPSAGGGSTLSPFLLMGA